MLRYKGLHDAPRQDISHSAVAEDYHISGRLAAEAEEGESLPLGGSIIEEHARSLVDEESSYTSGHIADTGNRSDCRLREHVTDSRKDISRP